MIYKIAQCPQCHKRHRDPAGESPGVCRCGTNRQWIKPRSGGSPRWYTRIRGREIALSPNQRSSQAQAGKLLAQDLEGRSGIVRLKPVGWKTAVGKFLASIEPTTKVRTVEFYRGRLKTLGKFFSPFYLHKITKIDIDDYVQTRNGLVSGASINRELTALKRLLGWAKERHHVTENVVEGYPEFDEQARDRVYTEQETEKILKECQGKKAPEHLFPIVVVALDTGLRKFDVLNLKRAELDFESGFIRKKTCVKQRKPHPVHIPMTSRVKTVLKEHLARQKIICEYVFPSKKRVCKPMSYASKIGFASALKRIGIEEGTFHDLRRTFATRWAERGGDMKTLQEILDHSSIEITARIYTKVSEQRKRDQMEVYENGS